MVAGWGPSSGYPNTDEFIQAFADLIRLREQGVPIKIIPDNPGGKEPADPLCYACRMCKKEYK
ncbi:MAG: hypothetical protein UX91_C0006G0080 [Candidatus Amesbacteria bacterium GW2011_GWB1_47_19]|nr:MAG: hypothetical protein UW51_C0002G0081 [Candidatus Amesbacteria bacterium GW2011_GWA1_44_24]KKU31329.1 MAG: hypothetical protein UX46_C0006G0121 [Candidatus Amesbacteria bacterium GW2011_GWC1_46_24]KKU67018.1 MAG: hypothetical protein UX91_C0006G0080 [Candidatus Amesbacteria bacterium GW2011_GWB1_47_19]